MEVLMDSKKLANLRVIPESNNSYYIANNGEIYRYKENELYQLKAHDRKTSHVITVCDLNVKRKVIKIDILLADIWDVEYAVAYLKKHNLKKYHLYSEEKKQILEKRKQGQTFRSIASDYNVSMQAITKIVTNDKKNDK